MISNDTKKILLDIYKEHNIKLEGNILKLIPLDEEEDDDFKQYITDCISSDKGLRRFKNKIKNYD
jgi:hypothetical protein